MRKHNNNNSKRKRKQSQHCDREYNIKRAFCAGRTVKKQRDFSKNSSSSSKSALSWLQKREKRYKNPYVNNSYVDKNGNNQENGASLANNLIETEKKTLSPGQKTVLALVKEGRNVFFSGSAGTGKSFLLERIILSRNSKTYVTASTGIAACNIGGTTIYSFAGVGLGRESKEELALKVRSNRRSNRRWNSCDCLIIDEVSMISASLFDKLEFIARKVRGSNRPFGGIQVILCGDFFQLPPVSNSTYCFQSKAWNSVVQESVILQQVFRQKDDDFITMLNEIRVGTVSHKTASILDEKVKQSKLNTSKSSTEKEKAVVQPTRLYPRNRQVDLINCQQLQQLKTKPYEFNARDSGKASGKTQLDKSCLAPTRLVLKEKAQVVLLCNLDTKAGLVNGARGVVVGFKRKMVEDNDSYTEESVLCPRVKFERHGNQSSLVRLIEPHEWKVEAGGTVLARRVQIPLKLAWSLSIHKSQGMTIDSLEVSLAAVFEPGQAYVALSRATTLDGLQVNSWNRNAIRSSSVVRDFYKSIENAKKAKGKENRNGNHHKMAATASSSGNDWIVKRRQRRKDEREAAKLLEGLTERDLVWLSSDDY
eukprot:g16.t1